LFVKLKSDTASSVFISTAVAFTITSPVSTLTDITVPVIYAVYFADNDAAEIKENTKRAISTIDT